MSARPCAWLAWRELEGRRRHSESASDLLDSDDEEKEPLSTFLRRAASSKRPRFDAMPRQVPQGWQAFPRHARCSSTGCVTGAEGEASGTQPHSAFRASPNTIWMALDVVLRT